MALIEADKVVIEFPIYGQKHQSLKRTMLHAATGGVLATDSRDHVVVRALDGVSLTIREGDRIGLIGHNGSGKSTLLRVFAGAYEPVSGSIQVQGSVASMLSITLGLDPEATGMENIFLRAALMGVSGARTREMLEEICDFAELGDYINMPIRTYSSGMSMRLAFAISTSVSSDILLMDEWLSVGDATFSEKAARRLNVLVDSAKIFVLASHDAALVNRICNRLITLEHGRIVADER
jgi:lipopolysaccharide transport system ATP-binding protein